MRSSAIMTARTSRRNSDRIRALLPAAAAIIIWCYGYLPLLISRLRRNGAGRDRETGLRRSAGDAPFQQQSAIALPKGRETGASFPKRRFSAFFCRGRHSDDKAHCTRFVQCASCKEWGVQPQSATSRLPIQRKGEREIAESCYVRMIPRESGSPIAASGSPEPLEGEIYEYWREYSFS